MAIQTNSIRKSKSFQKIFKRRKLTNRKTTIRLSIESIVMLIVSFTTLALLHHLSNSVQPIVYFSSLWLDLVSSLTQLIYALFKIITTLLITLLLILSFVLLLGGMVRLFRVITRVSLKKNRQNYIFKTR